MSELCEDVSGKAGEVLVWVNCPRCKFLHSDFRKKCTKCEEGEIQFGHAGYLLCLECKGRGYIDE